MRRAFTLIEVMVALAIFALAAIVLGGAYVNVLNAYNLAQQSNHVSEDVRYARSQLLAEPDLNKAQIGNDFDSADGGHVKWHATIASAGVANLFQVTFVCEFTNGAGGGPPTVTENFTLLRPTWADPVADTKLRQDAIQRIRDMQATRK